MTTTSTILPKDLKNLVRASFARREEIKISWTKESILRQLELYQKDNKALKSYIQEFGELSVENQSRFSENLEKAAKSIKKLGALIQEQNLKFFRADFDNLHQKSKILQGEELTKNFDEIHLLVEFFEKTAQNLIEISKQAQYHTAWTLKKKK